MGRIRERKKSKGGKRRSWWRPAEAVAVAITQEPTSLGVHGKVFASLLRIPLSFSPVLMHCSWVVQVSMHVRMKAGGDPQELLTLVL